MEKYKPIEWLKIDIANNFGNDKLKFVDRIKWVDENLDNLESLQDQADSPCLYYSGVVALRRAMQGLPINHSVALDATSSGTQLIAILLGDLESCKLSNVVDTGERVDLYTLVYEELLKDLGLTKEQFPIIRDDVKQAIMTALYSSESIPRQLFGKYLPDFHKVMERMMGITWDFNQYMLENWNPNASRYDWIMPDNFHAHFLVEKVQEEVVEFLGSKIKVSHKVNAPVEKGRCLSANTIHSVDSFVVRELVVRCMGTGKKLRAYVQDLLDGKIETNEDEDNSKHDEIVAQIAKQFKSSKYLSARVLMHLRPSNIHMIKGKDIQELLNSLPKNQFDIKVIHDSFAVHPNYCNDLREQFTYIYASINKSELLNHILKQIIPNFKPFKVKHFPAKILKNNYALC